MELEEIKRKILTTRDNEENQEINGITVIKERMRNINDPTEPNETDICTCRNLNYTIRNETEEYLPFKKVDQRKLRDITKKVNAVIRHIETDDVAQTHKLAMEAALYVAIEVGVKKGKRREKKEPWWKRIESDITSLRRTKGRTRRK